VSKLSKVLLVGHCGLDSGSLHQLVRSAKADVSVIMVNSQAELDRQANADALLLVNRVLDGAFEADDGIDLIGRLAKNGAKPAMMLISNYPDAQAAAVEAGAMPGFGKSQAGSQQTVTMVREALGG